MNIPGPLLDELWRKLEKCSVHDLRRVFLTHVEMPLAHLTGPDRGLDEIRTDVIEWLPRQEQGTVETFFAGLHAIKPRAGFDALAARILNRPSPPAPPVGPPPGPGVAAGGPVMKTVLNLDMVGYTTIARQLDATVGSSAVKALNQQIQGFVDEGLKAIAQPREHTVVDETGDGAILVFDDPNAAHHFAVATYAAVKASGARRGTAAPHQFRFGAATGEITLERREGRYSMAGITIANAVRLETAAGPGTLLVDVATYRGLAPDVQARYADEETVRGKREETFVARRCVLSPEDAGPDQPVKPGPAAPTPPPATGTRREIVKLFSLSFPVRKLDTLLFLLEMPVREQPPNTLPYDERWPRVVSWADRPDGVGLVRLETELRWLIASEAT